MLTFLRRMRPVAALLGLALAGCNAEPAPAPVRPALVVQASTGGPGVEAYAGEVRAREEPQLAFRLPGKVTTRRVDAGARVRAGQALAELDPADARLQAEADRAALSAAARRAARSPPRATRSATRCCVRPPMA